MRKAIVAGNWKMHKTASEAVELVAALKPLLAGVEVETAVCPPFTSLQAVHAALEGSAIGLGAQNMHCEGEGAFTGEVSAEMIQAAMMKFRFPQMFSHLTLPKLKREQAGVMNLVLAGLSPGATIPDRKIDKL